MRSREQIEEDQREWVSDARTYDQEVSVQMSLLLEVQLDIRDLLLEAREATRN